MCVSALCASPVICCHSLPPGQVHQGLRGTKSIRASLAAAASRLGRIGRSADPSPERCGTTAATAAAAAASAAAAVERGTATPNGKAGGAEGWGHSGRAAMAQAGSKAGSLEALGGRRASGAGRQPLAVEFVPITLVCRNLRWGKWGAGAADASLVLGVPLMMPPGLF